MATTKERLDRIMTQDFGWPLDILKPEASFTDDIGMDDLDRIQMIMSVETEFDLEIGDDAAEQMLTIGDLVTYIDKAGAR